jgi:hypothetical protein
VAGLVAFKGEGAENVGEESEEDRQAVGYEQILGVIGVDVCMGLDCYLPNYRGTAIVSFRDDQGIQGNLTR